MNKSCTISELIAMLQKHNPNTDVEDDHGNGVLFVRLYCEKEPW